MSILKKMRVQIDPEPHPPRPEAPITTADRHRKKDGKIRLIPLVMYGFSRLKLHVFKWKRPTFAASALHEIQSGSQLI